MLQRLIRQRKYLSYCVEALIDLAVCKFFIGVLPFRWYAQKYGCPQSETLQESMHDFNDQIIAIRCALRVVLPYIPWHSKCLDQAMAAQRMLRRRNLQSTLYFGVAREKEQSLMAHAWLRCGDRWIVGYQPFVQYCVMGTYAWVPNA